MYDKIYFYTIENDEGDDPTITKHEFDLKEKKITKTGEAKAVFKKVEESSSLNHCGHDSFTIVGVVFSDNNLDSDAYHCMKCSIKEEKDKSVH